VRDIDPRYVEMLIAYEDIRFRTHHGVDPLAVGARRCSSSRNGRIVSGGSTITMQVARLLEPRTDRTFVAKLRQAVRAIQLERALSKDEILTLYLGLAPYGGNLEGTRAASLAYFGKEPRRLSLGEAALLVAIPQSPELRRPDRSAQAAHARATACSIASASPAASARRDRAGQGRAVAGGAPADADAGARTPPTRRSPPRGRKVIGLTIDATMQKPLEDLARERACARPDIAVAIMVIDHATGEVLGARSPAADYFDERRAGQVDMTQAVRSPGSTLNPSSTASASRTGDPSRDADRGRPVRYGSLRAGEFDLTFQGTVSVRKALQMSLNVPAVTVLDAMRANRLTARITDAGARFVLPKGEVPGLAMGLGGVGSLARDLTMLYAGTCARRRHARAHRAARPIARRRSAACSIRSPPGMSAT
jgi:penicillin-binding protein 1C